MKTIALYMRLSNEDDHEEESCSIENQRSLLLDYVKNHEEFKGWNVLEFLDDGYSGVSFERPGIQKLLALAGGTVDCIIVKDFSRFGRNLVEVGDYLDQIFPFLGVRFIAVNEGYDSGQGLGGSIGLDVSLKALIYEMYSRDVSDKIRSVKHVKMRRGEYQGTMAFYGYQRSGTARGKLEIDEPAAEVVRRIFRMAAEGISPTNIAVELNRNGIPSPLMYRRENHTDGGHSWRVAGDMTCWTRENVRRTLSDERYTGRLVSHKRAKDDVSAKISKLLPREAWIIAEDAHEAIISKELFEQAQTVMGHGCRAKAPGKAPEKATEKPSEKPSGKSPEKPSGKPTEKSCRRFKGLLKCAHCGRALTRCSSKTPYYYCITRRALPGSSCAGVHIGEKELEDSLLEAVRIQVRLAQASGTARPGAPTEESILQEKLQKCGKAADRCKVKQAAAFEDYAEGRISRQEYLSRKREISGQMEGWNREYIDISDRLAEAAKYKDQGTCDLSRYALVNELTREVLAELVKEVRIVGNDEIEIVWSFRE